MIDSILEKIKEKSTWAGLLGALSVIGFTFSPELKDALASVILAFVSVVAILVKEKK